jgi:hypothetical protein
VKNVAYKQILERFRRQSLIAVSVAEQLIYGFHSKIEYRKFRLIRRAVITIQNRFRYKRLLKLARERTQALLLLKAGIMSVVAQDDIIQRRRKAIRIARFWRRGVLIAKMQRIAFCNKLMKEIANEAVERHFWHIKDENARIIQRCYRGYRSRKKNYKFIEQMAQLKDTRHRRRALKFIHKHLRGYIVRVKIRKIQAAAVYIQNYFRSIWCRGAYLRMKEAALVIQRHSRRFLAKKRIKDAHMRMFLKNYYIPYMKDIMKEQSKLYKINVPLEQLYKDEELPVEFYEDYKIYDQAPDLRMGNQGKLGLYLQVIDLSFIADSRTIYKDGWANYYIRASEECKEMNSELRAIQVGETHAMVTTITGKCFAWGYNDHGQLLSNDKDIIYHSFKLLRSDAKCENIVSGGDHVFVIDKENNVYSYGRNDTGQLGLGHNKDVGD